MKVGIVGSGYVGLVSGTCFAEMGNYVSCVDIDEAKVAMLRKGRMPIYEPDLDILLKRNLRNGRLTFTTSLEVMLERSDIVFLALPTPSGAGGEADLTFVLRAAEDIGIWLSRNPGYKIVVNKSTVPVGTAGRVRAALQQHGIRAGVDFDVVSNPEFLREGSAVDDFMKPDRVVIGATSPQAQEFMQRLYEPFVRQGNPIYFMDERSAEVTKYAANAILAARISFMNEIALLCEKVGANVDQVRIGIGSDTRIGKHFLYAGIGFGGSCFPKDVRAFLRTAKAHDYNFRILSAALQVNEDQRKLLVGRVSDLFDGKLKGKRAAIWGLAFKPNTDDVREAPAHVVIRGLLAEGMEIVAYDPEAVATARAILGDRIRYAEDAYSTLQEADVLIICTEWPEFRRPDFERMKQIMRHRLIVDGRNLYSADRMRDRGFLYFSIGRP